MKPQTISKTDLAQACGLTVRRLNQLVAEKKIPAPLASGKFASAETLSALFGYFRGRKESEDAIETRLRRLRAQADIAELDFKERQESLVPVADLDFWLVDVFTKIRSDFLHLASKVAHDWESSTVRMVALRNFLDDEIRAVLTAAADGKRYAEISSRKKTPRTILAITEKLHYENRKPDQRPRETERNHPPHGSAPFQAD